MPNPKNYKDKQVWMGDCMHQTKKVEGKPQDQSVAICLNKWRNKDKKKKVKKTAGEVIRCIAAALYPPPPGTPAAVPGQDSVQEMGKNYSPHHYIVSKTYEVVTPESEEEGDADDRGFEYENEKYDTLRDLVSDSANRENWVEWSSTHLSGDHEWLTSEGEKDIQTGEYTSYGLHIKRSDGKPLSKREVDTISKAFRVTGYKYIGSRQE
jgi:hypothetical protein